MARLNQNVYRRARGVGTLEVPRRLRQLLPVVAFFAIAFTVDMITGQSYSSAWGSAAIVASVIHLVPAIRPALVALGGYAAIWVTFNLGRAFAEDIGLAIAEPETIDGWERAMFGGKLPSASMQARWFDAAQGGMHDVLLSLVHASFFIMPFLMAGMLWWKRRRHFRDYAGATAATFALDLLGFVFLPTAPPWMSDPGEVTRVTHHVLEQSAGFSLGGASGGDAFWFEPNDLAALPSVHVAATVLVFLAARRLGTLAGWLGGLYALLMTLAVVYLGEHFVIDALLGWGMALVGWHLSRAGMGFFARIR